MNKKEIIDFIAENTESSKKASEETVNKLIEKIFSITKRGEEVSIAGFGTFVGVKRKAREARNPRTGETVKVPATISPKFKPAKAFKDALKK